MRSGADGALLAASLAFAGAAVWVARWRSAISFRASPSASASRCRFRPGSAGWGAGVAAPWPMPAAAIIVPLAPGGQPGVRWPVPSARG